jgi:hypothetical protein
LIRLFARLVRLAEIRHLLDVSSQATAGRTELERHGATFVAPRLAACDLRKTISIDHPSKTNEPLCA